MQDEWIPEIHCETEHPFLTVLYCVLKFLRVDLMLNIFTTTIIWNFDCLLSPVESKLIKCKNLEKSSFILLVRMSMGKATVENSIEVPQKIKN